MNKKLEEYLLKYGFNIENNSANGYIKGYETNMILRTLDNVAPLSVHISFHSTDEQKRKIESEIRNARIKYMVFSFTPYGLAIGLNDLTLKRLIERLDDVFDVVYGIITEAGGTGREYCPVCGEPFDNITDKVYGIDGFKIRLSADCVENINGVIEAENKDYTEAPNNYFKGFLGALIGGLAGAFLSFAMYTVGFITSLSALVAVALGAFLYKKFNGKQNKMMIVIVTITSFVCIISSLFGSYIFDAGIAASEAGVDLNAFEAFLFLLQDGEYRTYLYLDLGLTLLFFVLGVVYQIIFLNRSIRRKSTLSSVDSEK